MRSKERRGDSEAGGKMGSNAVVSPTHLACGVRVKRGRCAVAMGECATVNVAAR